MINETEKSVQFINKNINLPNHITFNNILLCKRKLEQTIFGRCETFKKIELSTNAIKVGEDISIMNLNTETEIAKILVQSIKYGRQVKMCWIGDGKPMPTTYITVGGCSKN